MPSYSDKELAALDESMVSAKDQLAKDDRLESRPHVFTPSDGRKFPSTSCDVCGGEKNDTLHDATTINEQLRGLATRPAAGDPDDLRYREFITVIAQEDAKRVLEKDKAYGASWKKRGGVGAFFAFIRKIDRLNTQVPGPNGDYDILRQLSRASTPGDESLLDTIRDIRGYLLLIEAEYRSRRVECDQEKSRLTCPSCGLRWHTIATPRTYPIHAICGDSNRDMCRSSNQLVAALTRTKCPVCGSDIILDTDNRIGLHYIGDHKCPASSRLMSEIIGKDKSNTKFVLRCHICNHTWTDEFSDQLITDLQCGRKMNYPEHTPCSGSGSIIPSTQYPMCNKCKHRTPICTCVPNNF